MGCVPINFGSTPIETENLIVPTQVSTGPPPRASLVAQHPEEAGLKPDARFDIEGPSVKKPGQ